MTLKHHFEKKGQQTLKKKLAALDTAIKMQSGAQADRSAAGAVVLSNIQSFARAKALEAGMSEIEAHQLGELMVPGMEKVVMDEIAAGAKSVGFDLSKANLGTGVTGILGAAPSKYEEIGKFLVNGLITVRASKMRSKAEQQAGIYRSMDSDHKSSKVEPIDPISHTKMDGF